jgi:5'(3')-deoxyribonucleotidase
MKKPRLLLDVDGILADYVGATIKVMNAMSGENITPDDIVKWEVTEALENHSLREKCKDAFNQAGFCLTFEAYDGAQDAVARLALSTEIFFVTAPMIKNPTWMPDRLAWLMHHFGVDHKHVVFATKKHIFIGDFMVDDNPENITSWLQNNDKGAKGILWDRPYNKTPDTDGLIHVSTWNEVIQIIEGPGCGAV